MFAAACLCLLFMLASVDAKADAVTFSTTGKFTCAGCMGDGTNSVTIGTGFNTLVLTFTGVDNVTLNTGPDGFTSANFGEIKVIAGSTGATIPPNTQLSLQVIQTAPSQGGGQFVGILNGFISPSTTTGELKFIATSFSVGAIRYDVDAAFKVVPFLNNGGVTTIQGKITATPEPATMILLSTGILGVTGALRWRGRR